jgi:hypothetical protein
MIARGEGWGEIIISASFQSPTHPDKYGMHRKGCLYSIRGLKGASQLVLPRASQQQYQEHCLCSPGQLGMSPMPGTMISLYLSATEAAFYWLVKL